MEERRRRFGFQTVKGEYGACTYFDSQRRSLGWCHVLFAGTNTGVIFFIDIGMHHQWIWLGDITAVA